MVVACFIALQLLEIRYISEAINLYGVTKSRDLSAYGGVRGDFVKSQISADFQNFFLSWKEYYYVNFAQHLSHAA